MRSTAVMRNHRRSLRGVAMLASTTLTAMTAVLAIGGPPAQAASSIAPNATSSGTISTDSELNGVSAVPATKDAWAVGEYITRAPTTGLETYAPLIEQWNGSAWKKVPGLRLRNAGLQLNAVSADSAKDAWAVGHYGADGEDKSLIMRWNGSAWKQVPGPSPKNIGFLNLLGVSAVSAKDAWAVGMYATSNSSDVYKPLILHWNGTAWKQVPSPVSSGLRYLNLRGVSADSHDDAWTAGIYDPTTGPHYAPLILHWNGKTWTRVKYSNPSGTTEAGLAGVSAVSPTEVWAAGSHVDSSGLGHPLILKGNGTAWKQVNSPGPHSSPDTGLESVSADSTTDAWAAGLYFGANNTSGPLILHATGTTWKLMNSSVPSGTDNYLLNGVSAVSANEAWAVGYDKVISTGYLETVVYRCNDTACKVVKSPNGTM